MTTVFKFIKDFSYTILNSGFLVYSYTGGPTGSPGLKFGTVPGEEVPVEVLLDVVLLLILLNTT